MDQKGLCQSCTGTEKVLETAGALRDFRRFPIDHEIHLHGTDSVLGVVTCCENLRYNPKNGILFQDQFAPHLPGLRKFKVTPIFIGLQKLLPLPDKVPRGAALVPRRKFPPIPNKLTGILNQRRYTSHVKIHRTTPSPCHPMKCFSMPSSSIRLRISTVSQVCVLNPFPASLL